MTPYCLGVALWEKKENSHRHNNENHNCCYYCHTITWNNDNNNDHYDYGSRYPDTDTKPQESLNPKP